MKSWGLICQHICWIFFLIADGKRSPKQVWQEIKPFNISFARMDPQFDSLLMVTMWSSLNDNHLIAAREGSFFVESETLPTKDTWNFEENASGVRLYTDG